MLSNATLAVIELTDIKTIKTREAELLGAVGIESVSALAQSDAEGLHEELLQANSYLGIVDKAPDLKRVKKWITDAEGRLPQTSRKSSAKVEKPVRLEPDTDKEGLFDGVLAARPVETDYIIEHEIAVADVPIMTDFVDLNAVVPAIAKPEPTVKSAPIAMSALREISSSTRIPRAKEPLGGEDEANEDQAPKQEKRGKIEPLKRNTGFDIRKTASPKLNEGKKLHSRAYIRGVLHPQPGRVRMGAIFSALTLLLFPASILAAGYFLLNADRKEEMVWLTAIPVTFLVVGFLYLTVSRPLKCRICGQPLFSRKACFKHVKAHRIRFLGYILPTSLHMLLFHWFRCIYCGTSVRLKK